MADVTKRDIADVLLFREDISPFLVHLTRTNGSSAKDRLISIINSKSLKCGAEPVSDARFGIVTSNMREDQLKRYFGAICLTETPLSEVHCLLDIKNRKVDLEPYGIVFLKETLVERSRITPVHYYNNHPGGDEIEGLVKALCKMINSAYDEQAARLLPLVSVFGRKLTGPGAPAQDGIVDFRWEREWRLPSLYGDLTFDRSDVFIGLCPSDEIAEFEGLLPDVRFIDPCRPMKWYAAQLVEARKSAKLKYSVV